MRFLSIAGKSGALNRFFTVLDEKKKFGNQSRSIDPTKGIEKYDIDSM